MSSGNLQRLKIMWGNDMYPCIEPRETLYLDAAAKPDVGDVVLFESRYGMRILHRLLFEFCGYYFTRGDNCPVFNFPFRKDKLLGVVPGKGMKVHRNPVGDLLLVLFLPYFEAYRRLFDLKKKRHFILLGIASGFYPHIPAPMPDGSCRTETKK